MARCRSPPAFLDDLLPRIVMIMPICKPEAAELDLLDEAIGYLNFSSGASDPKFLSNHNGILRAIESRCDKKCQSTAILCGWLDDRARQLSGTTPAFGDVSQA